MDGDYQLAGSGGGFGGIVDYGTRDAQAEGSKEVKAYVLRMVRTDVRIRTYKF